MSPGFGFSVGDFIAAIELCTKVAKALKDSGTAAAEYQQVVLELQGLQNVLARLAALEPTRSNIQYVNAIRAAAMASTLSLQEFLSKLERFEPSMSPFAAKKPFTMNKAGRQTQYAVFMAEEIQKMRALIYGNVIRINVLLATNASETLSRVELQLATHDQTLAESFQDTRDEMAKVVEESEQMKAQIAAHRAETRQHSLTSSCQVQEISSKVDSSTEAMTQRLTSLSAGLGSITDSISGIRNLSSQIISLIRVIPVELGGMIQNIIRSNARIESTLLRMDQNIGPSPSMALGTNIQFEDALGRTHADIPFEWFQYWETFEGLLKARFKDVPGRPKIENGEYRLVFTKRPTVSLDKDSWSDSIYPGAHIVMLMLISNVAFKDSSCPRRSCTGKVSSNAGAAGMVTCPECGLRFIPQAITADSAEADEITRLQRIEDEKLFGDVQSNDTSDTQFSNRIQDATEDMELLNMSGKSRLELTAPFGKFRHALSSTSVPGPITEPPIMSWLSQTVPPQNPETARTMTDSAEADRLESKKRDAKDLEIFRNVQIVVPVEASSIEQSEQINLEDGARIYYRNILDRYPQLAHYLARRLAMSNWERQKRLTVKQSEAERAKLRAQSREAAPEGPRKRKSRPSRKKSKSAPPDMDSWEDEDGEDERPTPLQRTTLHQPIEAEMNLEQGYMGQYSESAHCWPPSTNLTQQTNTLSLDPFSGAWGYQGLSPPTIGSQILPTFQDWNMFANTTRSRERRICSLPPLPVPVAEFGVTKTFMLCYLCHSQVQIQRKQDWRNHVMDDLQPYVCPLEHCRDTGTTFSRRSGLLQHIWEHMYTDVYHAADEHVKCPFCEVANLPGPLEGGGRAYVKHLGHHMEEIAFGVVSTAYENWSYDESGSDPEYQSFGGGFNSSLLSTTANTPSLLPLEVDRNWPGWGNADFETRILHSDNQQNPFWADVQAPDDTKYERNIWTGEVTATSPASSANSDLRAPYPVDYLSAGSAGSESNSFPRRKSTIVKRTTTKKKTEGTKRVGRRKGPLRPDQRHQAAEIRKLRACLRCKFLKKTCDKGDPCSGCQPSHARLWTVPCTRINIKDLGYFLKDWKADYERHLTLGFSAVFVKGFSSQERLLHLTHGYGHYLSLSAREVYLRDGCDLGVDWVEAKQTESGSRVHQQFKVDTAKLSAGIEGISSADMMAYLDKHIDHGFEDFVDAHFEGTPFLTEFLKTTYRCMVRDKSAVLRKALRFLVAYNLTLNLTMMEAGPEDDGSGRVQDPDSKLFGKIATPVTINFQVKYCLADIWREIHKDLLQDLGAFYESVYGGEKLRNWGSIFFITLILLAVWEEMQFDCHYRIHDEAACRKFCSDMETVPLATLLGLFYAISQKLPPIAEWEFANSISGFNPSEALRDAMMEMRSHVIKYESYLRSRLTDATFDREDFDSLSNKFLARLVLRGNMTASSHVS